MIIDIYGLVVKCQTDSLGLAAELTRPFSYFSRDNGRQEFTVMVKEEEPPYGNFPSAKAKFSTPRNVVYGYNDCKIIDYFGKGVIFEERQKKIYTIYSCDRNFLMEAFYLLILSLFGQFCDKKGMLRIHGLGLSFKDKALILMMPPGGGKSTMAIEMLKEEGICLISDDSPVFDKLGLALPFPVRLGIIDENTAKSIPEKHVYKINRMEFGFKYFVDYNYWSKKIEKKHLNDIILFMGHRVLNSTPAIEKASKLKVLACLFRDAVMGVGLYQGLEFILNSSAWEILAKMPVLYRRLMLAIKLLFMAKTYRFTISRDIAQNNRVFKEFIHNLT